MDSEVENDIPITGAVFTFGESSFADNCPSHFFIRNDPIIDIACGEEHTIVVCQNGRVFGFGGNGYGQVGLGHTNRVIKPSCVKSLKPDRVCLVACGQYHTLIYTETGFVYGWGNNSDGQLGLSENDICESKLHPSLTETDSIACSVKQISAGSCHSVLLTLDGRVYVWGSNQHGQLGLGDGIKKSGVPVLLPAPDDVVQISCGLYHTMLLSYDGKVFIFGHGESGKLGLGGNNSVPFPIPVGFDELSSQINGIAAGGNYSMAFAEDGTVYAWGNNDHGQLGLEREEMKEINKPTIVSLLRTVYVKKVICGYRHTAFITDKHELYMCGETTSGKLCLDNEETEIYINKALLPAKVTKFKDCIVEKVACGGRHTMVLAAAAEKFIDKQEIISAPSDASKSCVTIPDVTDVNNTSEENNDHSSHTPSEFPSPLPPKNIPSNNSSPNNSMKYNTHGSIINGNNNDAVSVNSVASSSKKDDDVSIQNNHDYNSVSDEEKNGSKSKYSFQRKSPSTPSDSESVQRQLTTKILHNNEEMHHALCYSNLHCLNDNHENSSNIFCNDCTNNHNCDEKDFGNNCDRCFCYEGCNEPKDNVGEGMEEFNVIYEEEKEEMRDENSKNINGNNHRTSNGNNNNNHNITYYKCNSNNSNFKCDQKCLNVKEVHSCNIRHCPLDICIHSTHQKYANNQDLCNPNSHCDFIPRVCHWYSHHRCDVSNHHTVKECCKRQNIDQSYYEKESQNRRIIECWLEDNRLKNKRKDKRENRTKLKPERTLRIESDFKNTGSGDSIIRGFKGNGGGNGSNHKGGKMYTFEKRGLFFYPKSMKSNRNITNDHINIADRKTNIESPESSSKHLQNMNNSKEVITAKSDSMLMRIFGNKRKMKTCYSTPDNNVLQSIANDTQNSESFSESKRDEEESTSKRDDPKDKKKNSFRANGVPPNGITRGHQKNSRMCVIL